LRLLRRNPKPSAQVAAAYAFQAVDDAVELGNVLVVYHGPQRQVSTHGVKPIKYVVYFSLALALTEQ